MAFLIDETIEVDATPEVVWSVICDFASYPDWNPFVLRCTSSMVVGEAIVMTTRMARHWRQSVSETVLEHVRGEHFCYGIPVRPSGILASRRSHTLTEIEARRTRYRSHFELSGWMAPVVAGLLGRQLRHGFHSMTDALCRRAETLRQHGPLL